MLEAAQCFQNTLAANPKLRGKDRLSPPEVGASALCSWVLSEKYVLSSSFQLDPMQISMCSLMYCWFFLWPHVKSSREWLWVLRVGVTISWSLSFSLTFISWSPFAISV